VITRPLDAEAIVARCLPLVVSNSGKTAQVVSPLDGKEVCQIPLSDSKDIDVAFETARTAFASWKDTNISTRIRYIHNFHDLLLANTDNLLDIVQWENGKTRSSGMDEILDIALTCQYYTNSARKILKKHQKLSNNSTPTNFADIIATINYIISSNNNYLNGCDISVDQALHVCHCLT
jgi:acyl-CoA reductase-like NAD-dependent aldehyde dehydrogenase